MRFLLALPLILALNVSALAFDVPALEGPVMDKAGLLSREVERELSEELLRFQSQGGAQIQILTLDTIGDTPIEQATLKIVEAWQLGRGKADDGLLFLISKAEKKMRIEVGQGLEGVIPDVVAYRLIDQVARPYFKGGDFDSGVVALVTALLQQIKPEYEGKLKPAGAQWRPTKNSLVVIIFFLIILINIFRGASGFSGRRSGLGGFGVGGLGGGFGGRGGFGGGGGGWSGGGGGFSGGGASGGW